MSYKSYKNKVQITKLFQRIKDRTLRTIFRILSLLLFPIWIPIFLVSRLINTVKYHSEKMRNSKLIEGRDVKKDRNFKTNMKIVYKAILDSREYNDSGSIYITASTVEDYLYHNILGNILDDSYHSTRLMHVYKNYKNNKTYTRAEVLQMIIDELKNDKNLSVRWITSIKELDIERDVRDIVTPGDYDLFNKMLDMVHLYRITERK